MNSVKVTENKKVITMTMDEDTAYAVCALMGHHNSELSAVATYRLFDRLKGALGNKQRYTVKKCGRADGVILEGNSDTSGRIKSVF